MSKIKEDSPWEYVQISNLAVKRVLKKSKNKDGNKRKCTEQPS